MVWDALDLFAGAGGWDLPARQLGIDTLGIELDEWAVATRHAAGLPTERGDVTRYGPCDFPAEGLIASPPCQTFSLAGNGAGRRALADVLLAVKAMAQGARPTLGGDPRTALVLEPLRWALEALADGRPYRWLALEQVPSALPVWRAMADVLAQRGYSVDAAVLKAEQYGVPQTRRRAILVARRDELAMLPTATHRAFRYRVPQEAGDPALLPWVSMADALGWGATARPSWTLCGDSHAKRNSPLDGGSNMRASMAAAMDRGDWVLRSTYSTDGVYANRGERAATEPAQSITSKADRGDWVLRQSAMTRATERTMHEPAFTLTAGKDHGEREWLPERVKLTEREAAVLQTFPADHPWQGTKGRRFQQIGNAIPPLLARVVLEQFAS